MSRRKILVAGAVLVVVLALIPVIAHYRAKAAAEKFKAQLRAQGERLAIAELIPLLSANTPNGSRDFLNAHARLTSFDHEIQPGVMKLLQPGRARIAWQQAALPSEKSADTWPALRAHLETNRAALADLRNALAQPVLHFPVNYHQGFSALLPHLAQLKSASQRLSAATLMAMRDQHSEEAFANLRALVALLLAHREEPFIISQLVRCAIASIAASATWEALQYPHWSDDQLARLQSAWESMQFIPQMEQALVMERACVLEEYTKGRDSLSRLDLIGNPGSASSALEDLADAGHQLMEDPAAGFESLMDRFPRRWIWKWWNCYDDEIWFLQAAQRSLDAAREAANGQPFVPLQEKVRAETSQIGEPPRQFLIARLLGGDIYPRALEKALVAETQRRILVAAIALKRFERQRGKMPSDLAAVVPGFLQTVPIDPMDGKPLRFRSTGTNSFLLYSVGRDGRDDGGDVDPTISGSRNFWWMNCKDWVWPQPATAEQLREFNVQLEQRRGVIPPSRRSRPR